MGIKRWRKVFSEVNCLENLSDQPEDWKSDEACTVCRTTSDAQPAEANHPQTAHLLSDPTDRASPSGQAVASELEATAAALSTFTSSLPPLASANQFGDYLDANNNLHSSFASLLTSMTTTPMMTNTSSLIDSELPLNSLNSLNSLNNLISTTESMAANQNGSNADLPNIKVVSSAFFGLYGHSLYGHVVIHFCPIGLLDTS